MTTERPGTATTRTTAKRPPDGRSTPSRGARKKAQGPGYHHGGLRKALLAATDTLLARSGLEGFTLREVARRAGVSHGAPAHHFGDARGLLSAYAAEGFAQLAQAMARRRATAPSSPFDQLVATGLGYVEYALAHRARFQLMFRSDRLDPDCAPLGQSGSEAYGHLVDCILRIDPGTDHDAEARHRQKTALAWSIVHGYATLMLENDGFACHAGSEPARALAMAESLLRSARPAFETQDPSGPSPARRRPARG